MTDKHLPPPTHDSPPPRSFGLVDHRAHWEELKRHLPPWKRKLLGVSLIIGILGFGTQITSKVLHHSAPAPAVTGPTQMSRPTQSTPGTASPSKVGGSGFVSGNPQPDPYTTSTPAPTATPAPTSTDSHTITDTITPWMGKLGISFFVGVVLGTVARAFVKLAAMGAVAIGLIFAGLSYFHVVNVDLTAMKTKYASATEWLEDQGGRLKNVAVGALPSSTSAMAGFFAGFKRR